MIEPVRKMIKNNNLKFYNFRPVMVFLGTVSVSIHLIMFFLDPSYYNVMLFIRQISRNLSNYLSYFLSTVGENIIATTKIRNNYGAIQSFIFPIFSIASCKVITLNPFCILFGIIFFFFFMAFFLKLSLFQLTRQRQLELFLALKGDSDEITVTFR